MTLDSQHSTDTHLSIVLFDAVGTLIYPDPPVAQVYYTVGCRHGSTLGLHQIDQRFCRAFADHCDARPTSEDGERRRWRKIVAQVFDDLSGSQESLFEDLWEHFSQAEHWALFADVLPAWEAVEAAGVSVGIASNFDQRLLNICRCLPPLNRAQHIFYSAAIGYSKPNVEFFRVVQQQLDFPAESILMVGDSQQNDVCPAQAVGWTALRIDRQGRSEDICTIESLMELGAKC